MRKYIAVCLVVFFGLVVVSLRAQEVNKQKLVMAKTYEDSGELENAARIYQELFNLSPENDPAFFGLVRTMKAMNKFRELLPSVEKRIEHKKNGEALNVMAELQWKLGEINKANEAWESAINLESNSLVIYYDVAQSQASLQLIDKAIATLKKGRDKSGKPSIYADELSRLYIGQGNFKEGSEEVLLLLRENKNVAMAQGRLFAFMTNEKAGTYLGEWLKSISDSESENIYIQELYAWYLKTSGQLDKALEVYIRMDKLKKSGGRDILQFADIARNEGSYDIALKAYSLIIELGKANPYTPTAIYGYARTLEQKFQQKSGMPKAQAEEVIANYRLIIKDYPKSSQEYDARFRIAVIMFEELNEPKDAIQELQIVMKNYGMNPTGIQAAQKLGEIYISLDDLDNAEKAYNSIQKYSQQFREDVDQANLKLADILFYRGNIDSAKSIYESLAGRTVSGVSNDALNRLMLMNLNKEAVRALQLFAKAELKVMQKDIKEASALYEEIMKISSGSDIFDRVSVKYAELKIGEKQYDKAIEVLKAMTDANPECIFGDYAMMLIGDCYSEQKNKEMALKYYTQLLSSFPKSIYLNEARLKIRTLRNDKI